MLQRLDCAASSLTKAFAAKPVLISLTSSVNELFAPTASRIEKPRPHILLARPSDARQSTDCVLRGNDASPFARILRQEVVVGALTSSVDKSLALIGIPVVKPSQLRLFARSGIRPLEADVLELRLLTSSVTILNRLEVVPIPKTSAENKRLAFVLFFVVEIPRKRTPASSRHFWQEAQIRSRRIDAGLLADFLAVEPVLISAYASEPESTAAAQRQIEIPFHAEGSPGTRVVRLGARALFLGGFFRCDIRNDIRNDIRPFLASCIRAI